MVHKYSLVLFLLSSVSVLLVVRSATVLSLKRYQPLPILGTPQDTYASSHPTINQYLCIFPQHLPSIITRNKVSPLSTCRINFFFCCAMCTIESIFCLYPHGVLPCSCYVYTPTEYFLVHVMFIPPRSTCLFMLCLYPHGVLPCSCYVYTPTEYFLVHVMFIPPRSTSLFMLCLYPHGVLPCSCYVYTPTEYFLVHVMLYQHSARLKSST